MVTCEFAWHKPAASLSSAPHMTTCMPLSTASDPQDSDLQGQLQNDKTKKQNKTHQNYDLKKEKKKKEEVEVGENTAVPGWLAHLHHHLCADQQQQLHQRLTSLAWGPGRWCPGCAGGPRPEPAPPGRTSRPPPWTSPAHSVKATGSEHQSGWPYTENCTGHRHWHASVSLRKGTFVGLASSLPFHLPHGHFNLPKICSVNTDAEIHDEGTKAQKKRERERKQTYKNLTGSDNGWEAKSSKNQITRPHSTCSAHKHHQKGHSRHPSHTQQRMNRYPQTGFTTPTAATENTNLTLQ